MSDNNDGSSSPSKRRKADIVPKVRRNATNVSKWFKVINDRKHCMYDECTASYALTTSTTNLMYHLTSEHELFLIDVESGDEIENTDPKSSKPYNSKYNAKKQAEINVLLIKFIVDDLQPFHLTMSKSFLKFIHALQPMYVVPDEKTVK